MKEPGTDSPRKTADEFREASSYWPSLFEASPNALMTIGLDGKVTDANKATEEATGVPRDRLIGSDFCESFTEPEKASAAYRQVLSQGFVKDYPLTIRHGSGRTTHILFNAGVYKDEAGEACGVLAAGSDVTERKRAGDEIVQLNERLSQERDFQERLLQTAQAIILVLDPDGRIVRFNPYMEEISGYRLDEVRGADWTETFVPERDRERVRQVFLVAIDDYQTRGNINSIVTKDGREREIEWYDKTLRDPAGNVAGLLSIGQDVTERKWAEAELSRVASFPERNENPIVEIDAKGRVSYMNPAARRLLPDLAVKGFRHPWLSGLRTEFARFRKVDSDAETREVAWGESVFQQDLYYIREDNRIRVYGADVTERKRAEDALRASEERFKAIASNTPDHVLMQDEQLRYVFVVNPQLGLTEEDMVGKTDHDFLAKEEADKLTEIKTRVLETAEPAHLETSLVSREGEAEFFDGTYVPKLDARGRVDGLIGYFRNTTERKRAEEALKTSEAFFRQLYDHMRSGSAVFEVTDDGSKGSDYVIRMINRAGLEMEGKTLEEVIGKRFVDIRPTIDRFGLIPVMKGVWETGKPAVMPAKIYIDERSSNYYENYVFKLPSGEVVTLYDDLTEHKRAEDAVRASEAKFSAAFHAGAIPMVITRASDDTMAEVNEAFLGLTGYSRQECIGRTTLELGIHAGPADRVAIMREIARSGSANDLDFRLRVRDGSIRRISLSMTEVMLGVEPHWLDMLVDVTQRSEAEEKIRLLNAELESRVEQRTEELSAANEELIDTNLRLEEATRAKSAFLAAMSHELRTPLNSIIGFSGTLLQGLAGPLNAEQERQLGMVGASGRHLLSLINDILDLSRIESGNSVTVLEEFEVPALVSDVVAMVRPLADAKGIDLTLACGPGTDLLRSDPNHVRQILINLLGNAVKFTDSGGVSLGICVENEQMVFAVTDTGIGIHVDDLPQLMDSFYQVASTVEAKSAGTGLGLAICSRLAEPIGGTIDVSSEFGVGSTFTLRVPCVIDPTA